jgi:serine/threonine protein kinase
MDEATNEASLDHKIPQRPFESTIGKYIDESVYRAIGTRLSLRQHYCDNWTKYSEHWNRGTVRLYTLLRMLGFKDGDNVFKRFECENVDDFWLPLNNSILKKIKSESLPDFGVLEFAKAQSYVMSDSKQMDEANLVRPFFERQYNQDKQKSRPRHRHIEHGIDYFADMGQIGEGSSAHVRRFRHEEPGKDSGRDFACKRLLRVTYTNLENQRNQLEYFKKEIEALSTLEYHRHIVSLVASFTDLESFSLILYPIADKVLLDLLKQTDPLSDQDFATLHNSFSCLATALEFLHANSIRHKDIKPSNILLSDGRVLLCDFGISHRWTDSENGTTEGGYSSFTHRYAAPEVLRVDASRNSKADIWSLGCVFLEILSVLKGCSFDQIMKGRGLSYSLVQEHEMSAWPKKINLDQGDTTHSILMDCVLMMVCFDMFAKM